MFNRGQTLLEYLLLLGLVAFVALASFRPGGVMDQTVRTSNEYFKTGQRAILGGYYDDQGKPVLENPSGTAGGWCAFSECINGWQVRECACPRPSFGGAACTGSAVAECGAHKTMCTGGLNYIPGVGCGCYENQRFDQTLNNGAGGCASCTPGQGGTCTPVNVVPCGTSQGLDSCGRPCPKGTYCNVSWKECRDSGCVCIYNAGENCPAADTINCGTSLGNDNCGNSCPGTGTRCSDGWSCSSGACTCPYSVGDGCPAASTVSCGSSLGNDRCGRACPGTGTKCSQGVCQNGACGSCPPGQTACNDGCKNSSSDRNNCGACGNVCSSAETCYGGACYVFEIETTVKGVRTFCCDTPGTRLASSTPSVSCTFYNATSTCITANCLSVGTIELHCEPICGDACVAGQRCIGGSQRCGWMEFPHLYVTPAGVRLPSCGVALGFNGYADTGLGCCDKGCKTKIRSPSQLTYDCNQIPGNYGLKMDAYPNADCCESSGSASPCKP